MLEKPMPLHVKLGLAWLQRGSEKPGTDTVIVSMKHICGFKAARMGGAPRKQTGVKISNEVQGALLFTAQLGCSYHPVS